MAEIVNVIYKTSTGQEYPFQLDRTIRIKSANFHKWEYSPDTLARRFGESVLRFGKGAVVYQTSLYLSGPVVERRELLKEMHTAFERDIRKAETGRLIWGDSYIDCFIRASSTYPDSKGLNYTVNDIEIYCPYPFWIEPNEYQFVKSFEGNALVGSAIVGESQIGNRDSSGYLDYPFDYTYDYASPGPGSQIVVNDSPSATPFQMVIFGPVANPYFYVGDKYYGVTTLVADGEYLTIDTQKKSVIRTMIDGTKINEFNNRSKQTSIFDPIPEGSVKIVWPATFGMTMTLLKERSEPVWS